MTPWGAEHRPSGEEKLAAIPTPSVQVALPEPARVATKQPAAVGVGVAVGEIDGVGEGGGVDPALAEGEGVGVGDALGHCSALTRWLLESEMYTTPLEASTATPRGKDRKESAARPSCVPAVPVPTAVLTTAGPAPMLTLRSLLLELSETNSEELAAFQAT